MKVRCEQPQMMFPVTLDEPACHGRSWVHSTAAQVVGEFFEHATAALLRGRLMSTEGPIAPDVMLYDGALIESKAQGGSGWVVYEQQLVDYETYVAEDGEGLRQVYYCLWHYNGKPPIYKACVTKCDIFRYLCERVISCNVLSLQEMRRLMTWCPSRRLGQWHRYAEHESDKYWRIVASRLEKLLVTEFISDLSFRYESVWFTLKTFPFAYRLGNWSQSEWCQKPTEIEVSGETPF